MGVVPTVLLLLVALPAILLLLLTLILSIPAQATPAAEQWRSTVLQELRSWPEGRATVIAALLHQESGWRPDVVSRAGARGMAQFMPGTEADMRSRYHDLAEGDALQPEWAIRAAVRYLHHQWARVQPMRQPGQATPRTLDDCTRLAMAASAYNGGRTWVIRDRRLALASGADPNTWFDHVERYTARAEWARAENRQYVRRVLIDHAQRYHSAGWPGGLPCV